MDGIYCLMIGGGALTDGLRTSLYVLACKMCKSGKKRTAFQGEGFEAVLRTSFKRAAFSSAIKGVKFVCDFATELGKIHVEFILQSRDVESALKYAEWMPCMSPEHPAQSAHLN